MVLDLRLVKIGCRDDNQFFFYILHTSSYKKIHLQNILIFQLKDSQILGLSLERPALFTLPFTNIPSEK